MNWELFSPIGYASIAVWLCMPLLWFINMFRRPRSWLCHVALVLGVAAYVLARINSETYINLIQVDRSQEIQEQLDRQEVARQAATQARKNEVAQIRFAEDGTDDFLDQGGMDAADIARISYTVLIDVRLGRVGLVRAYIAGIAHTVGACIPVLAQVRVLLKLIVIHHADITGIADEVAI